MIIWLCLQDIMKADDLRNSVESAKTLEELRESEGYQTLHSSLANSICVDILLAKPVQIMRVLLLLTFLILTDLNGCSKTGRLHAASAVSMVRVGAPKTKDLCRT